MSTPPTAIDPTRRFSDRVRDYIRYRPGYPAELMAALSDEFGLRPEHVIADIGCGTGISAALCLRNGNRVVGVEPNREMRQAAEELLAEFPRFRVVDAGAEQTTLADGSVDWVIAAQAFHWFEPAAARREFLRILRPGGRIALIWNNRREDTPFLAAYEALVREFASDYAAVKHQNSRSDGRLDAFFAGMRVDQRSFANRQRFDFDGLLGRVCSSSYMPARGAERFAAMVDALRDLFECFAATDAGAARERAVAFEYETMLYVGTPA